MVALLVALLVLLVSSRALGNARAVESRLGVHAPTNGASSFSITGLVRRPIAPGVSARVNVVLVNHSAVALNASRLALSIRAVKAPRADATHPCSTSDFMVQQAPTLLRFPVPAGGRTSLRRLGVPIASWPRVAMLDLPHNQDGCQGAILTIDYSAAGGGR
jgi:hypothetical protein